MTNAVVGPDAAGSRARLYAPRASLVIVLWLNVIIQCVSLSLASDRYGYFHLYFSFSDPPFVAASIVLFFGISMLFVVAEFSFGYMIGYTFFTIVMNFIWLNHYSRLLYDLDMVAILMVASLIFFLLPALAFGGIRFLRDFVVSRGAFSSLLIGLIVFIFASFGSAAGYNFRVVGLDAIYGFREQIEFPTALNYAVNISIDTFGPFVFACLIERRRYLFAACIALLLMAFYPITLSKGALFAPFWLTMIALIMGGGNPRFRFVALFLTVFAVGIAAAFINGSVPFSYFGAVNFRLFAIPASVIEHYLDYFQSHPTTNFCHVGFLQQFLHCLSSEQLSVTMNNYYKLGNQNGSFFATEGVAAMGYYFMPVAALICGALVGLGNVASSGLSVRFVAISGGMMPLIMNNVPMSTALFTGGYLLLLVLWLVTPRPGVAQAPKAVEQLGGPNLA